MFPIFVVDRPASLRILSGLTDHSGEFGILAHAFTTNNFKKKFNEFELASVKVGDSGIYQGKDISYKDLFSEYEKMGVTHGIIKDHYRDPVQTLKSAKKAIKVYKMGRKKGYYNFDDNSRFVTWKKLSDHPVPEKYYSLYQDSLHHFISLKKPIRIH